MSCSSAGNCAAGGSYRDTLGHFQAFVVTECDGHWRKALEVPGSGTLNAGGNAVTAAVSCPSAGECGAGGSYADASQHSQVFVTGET